ncbi:box C/D snoRNA protein 1 [Anopheles maculipalpis]|uniref:box C/D snoRNA protein 1 n=1 Tax=Anopheles maculipalpis TaxID=1496333 RepID=UPI00215951BD|nr:box C/D snoRNA protein 1 [Anopheles maculipalpis]
MLNVITTSIHFLFYNMISTEDVETQPKVPNLLEHRLGLCEACNARAAQYTCPRCEVKTCSLACLNLHKQELKCDGIRDRTKYIPLVKMTRVDLMNDYYFLEECTKFVQDRKRDHRKRFTCINKHLPNHLVRLQRAAMARGTLLKFMLQHFSKRQKNTTYLDFKSGKIMWRIEWCFPDGNETLVFVDENVSEDCKLHDIVDKYLQPAGKSNITGAAKLVYYQSRGISAVTLLLKAEGIKKCRDRTIPLNVNDTIHEALRGKTIVEFPTIYVVFTDHLDHFDVVNSDDDMDVQIQKYNESIKQTDGSSNLKNIEGRLDNMKISKLNRVNATHGVQPRDRTCNYLFSDDTFLNESSESDGEPSYDNESTVPKRLKSDPSSFDVIENIEAPLQ